VDVKVDAIVKIVGKVQDKKAYVTEISLVAKPEPKPDPSTETENPDPTEQEVPASEPNPSPTQTPPADPQ
jgi:hypothetical protein